jgi:hypothetical protein
VQRVRDRTGGASKLINNSPAHPSAVGSVAHLRKPGAKLTNEQIATGIIECECFDPKMADAALDPRCFALEGGPSIAEQNQVAAKVTSRPSLPRQLGNSPRAASTSGPFPKPRTSALSPGIEPVNQFYRVMVTKVSEKDKAQ